MAKISLGTSTGNSKLTVDLNLAHNSQFEVSVGDGHDMSTREIKVLERDEPQFHQHIAAFDSAISAATQTSKNPEVAKRLKEEAAKFRKAATTAVAKKKAVPVSTTGLVNVAKSIGAAATPILIVASKIIDILRKAQGL